MAIFGYLTYRNMRQLHLRIQPIDNHRRNITVQSRDRDLLKMVLAEVIVHLITIFLYPLILLEIAITTYMGIVKSIDHIQIENFIMTIATLFFFINVGSRFYIFFAISKIFRNDLKKIFKLFWNRFIRRNATTMNERVIPT